MITLLLIFFIVLYTMSKVNAAKFDQMVQVLSASFGGNKTVVSMHNMGILKDNPRSANSNKYDPQKPYLQAVKSLQKEIEGKNVAVTTDDRGTIIHLSADFCFGSGSADLTPQAYTVLHKLEVMLKDKDNNIQIEGHTDDVPININSKIYDRYPTNWELSSQRAINVLKSFENSGFKRTRLAAIGYADTRPVRPNDSDSSRTYNRRIEIIVLNEGQGVFADSTATAY